MLFSQSELFLNYFLHEVNILGVRFAQVLLRHETQVSSKSGSSKFSGISDFQGSYI